jgi:hypothetical protein
MGNDKSHSLRMHKAAFFRGADLPLLEEKAGGFCQVLSHPETENFITLEILAFGSFLFIIEYFILN